MRQGSSRVLSGTEASSTKFVNRTNNYACKRMHGQMHVEPFSNRKAGHLVQALHGCTAETFVHAQNKADRQ